MSGSPLPPLPAIGGEVLAGAAQATPTRAGEDLAVEYCTFRLGEHLCGIPVSQVQEVLRPQALTPVPLAPAVVRGLINLRGELVVALDLRHRLALTPAADATARSNVVVRVPDGAVSLLVDAIGDVLTVPASAIGPPPASLPAGPRYFMQGVCQLPTALLLVLATERLVDPHLVGESLEG